MTLWVFPSGDIHLVAASKGKTVGGKPADIVELRIVVQIPRLRHSGAWRDASTINNMSVEFEQKAQSPAGVQHDVTGFVGAQGGAAKPATVKLSNTVGTSFHFVKATLPPVPEQPGQPGQSGQEDVGLVRISTHDKVTALLAGDRSLSMFAGEADRVLTVYARFSDGAFEDVTGHPWLTYHVANPTVATVDPEGRIKGVAAGTTTVHVATWDDQFQSPFDVPITVRPALSPGSFDVKRECPRPDEPRTPRTVVVVELSRKAARQRTLYVLAEGYQDCGRFFAQARQVKEVLFGTRPYNRLSDRFHVVGVFQPSPDQGLTIGPRLVAVPRGPTDERKLWTGQPPGAQQPVPVPVERLFTRDTLFGLMAGARLVSTPQVPAIPPDQETIENPEQVFMAPRVSIVFLAPDDRRLTRFGLDTPTDHPTSFTPIRPTEAFASLIKRYLEAAGQTVGPEDRVAFLVDDEYYGGLGIEVLGVPLDSLPMVALTTGFSVSVHGVNGAGPVLDRTPLPGTSSAEVIGSRMAHELAHTYQLADEYEDEDEQRVYMMSPLEIDLFENIQHDRRLRRAGADGPLTGDPAPEPPLKPSKPSPPDVTRIKWNIPRIAKVSPVTAIKMVDRNNVRLTVEAGQPRRWRRGDRAFLRNSLVTPWNAAANLRTVVFAVQISDLGENTVDVGSLPPGFNPGILGKVPLLYLPKQNSSGVELGLIDPAVLDFLATNGPFPKPANKALWYSAPFDPPPTIPRFRGPDVRADAIGLYEGGGHCKLDVYRPTGRCMMRNPGDHDAAGKVVFDRFCFICQYVLVELLDPSKHEALDGDYPEDC